MCVCVHTRMYERVCARAEMRARASCAGVRWAAGGRVRVGACAPRTPANRARAHMRANIRCSMPPERETEIESPTELI